MTFLLSELLPSGKPLSSFKSTGFQALLESESLSSPNSSPAGSQNMLTVSTSALSSLRTPTKKLSGIDSVSLPPTGGEPRPRNMLTQTLTGSPLSPLSLPMEMPSMLSPIGSGFFPSSNSALSNSRNRIFGRSPLSGDGPRKIIQAPFTGKVQSTIECSKCFNHWSTMQPFTMLTAYFPPFVNSSTKKGEIPPITLQECLMSYTNAEKVNHVHCHHCKKRLPVKKRLSIAVPPPLLCIHLNRLRVEKAAGSIRINKINIPVIFDAEFSLTWAMTQLDAVSHEQERANQLVPEASSVRSGYSSLSSSTTISMASSHYRSGTNTPSEASFVPNSPNDASRFARGEPAHHNDYYLCAIIVHLGDASGGHYVCYRIKNEPSGDETNLEDMPWLYISDNRVIETTFKEVQRQNAYMLFYKSKFDHTSYEDQLQAMEERTEDEPANMPYQHMDGPAAVAASHLMQSQAFPSPGIRKKSPIASSLPKPTPNRARPEAFASNGSLGSTGSNDSDIFNKPSLADSYYKSPPTNGTPHKAAAAPAPEPGKRQLLEPEAEPDRASMDPLRSAQSSAAAPNANVMGPTTRTGLMSAMRSRPVPNKPSNGVSFSSSGPSSTHHDSSVPNGGEVSSNGNGTAAPHHHQQNAELSTRPLNSAVTVDEGFESILALSKPKQAVPNGHHPEHEHADGPNGLPNGVANGHANGNGSHSSNGSHAPNGMDSETLADESQEATSAHLESSYATSLPKEISALPNGFIHSNTPNGHHEELADFHGVANGETTLNELD